MHAFTDMEKREWKICLTIADIKRVKSLVQADLLQLNLGDPPLLTRLGTDIILLCDVIFAICKPQADEAKVTDEQFGAALGGDAILAAQKALYDELTDFFRQLGRRDLAKAVEKQAEIIKLAVQAAETRIDEINLETVIKEGMETSGKSSTSSPAPSE